MIYCWFLPTGVLGKLVLGYSGKKNLVGITPFSKRFQALRHSRDSERFQALRYLSRFQVLGTISKI
jgi:hypothetical protein